MPPLEKYSRSLDYTYAPGLFPTMEALTKRPAIVQRVLVSESLAGRDGLEQIERLCKAHGIRVETADKALSRISGKENCFAAAVVQKKGAPLACDTRHLMLHHPSDKGNLGTILRSALGFGFLDIAVITPAADLFDPHVVRASMGAMFALNIQEFESFEQYRALYPAHALYPFMLDGAVTPEEAVRRLALPYTLIMGNEGSGLPAAFQHEGVPVRIAHSDAIDSLNLSVAASIGMYCFAKAERSNAQR